MVAVHQDFGFDHRHDAAGLTDGGIAGQRMGIGMDGVVAGDRLSDIDHRPPLGEFGADLGIVGDAGGEPVEALGHRLAGRERQGLGAGVELDAGDGARRLDDVDERGSVLGFLADRLVEEDDARDVALHGVRRAEQHFAVVAAVLLGVRGVDRFEALGDRAGRLVGGQDALAGGHHAVGDGVQFVEHVIPPEL